MRNTWLKVARRDPGLLSDKSRLYFCEDHFDLEHDMENYIKYKIMGSVKRIKMKPDCIPSRFAWNRKHNILKESHPTEAKGQRVALDKLMKSDSRLTRSEKECGWRVFAGKQRGSQPNTIQFVACISKQNVTNKTHEIEDGNNSSTTNVETTEENNKPSTPVNLGPSSSQVSNLSQKYGSPYQSAVSCVYGSGSGAESPPPEHTAPSGDGKHTQLKQQVKRKRSGDRAARQPESLACSECGSRVAARVYVCVQCVDARMCAACEPHAHASHAVVRLPSTRVYNIVRDLFESLQAQLNCRLRGLGDDAEDELMDDLDDDELDQYIDLPAVKKTKPPVIAPSTSQEIIPPVASEVTSKTNPPASHTPTDETDEPMVMADAIKVEEQDPLRETAAEGFMRITSDIVKSERDEETVAEPKLAQDVRAADDTYIEINVPKSLVNESKLKIVNKTKGKSVGSNVTVVRKPKGKTAGNNVPVARKPTGNTTGSNVTGVRKTAGGNVIGNTSIERAQTNKSGSEITMEIKQEPPEDACTEEVDSTGFIVFGSHRSIEGRNKKTS